VTLRAIMAVCALALPGLAVAQTVEPCDWRARADAIPEPWEDHTRTFSDGEVRVAVLDVIEPAAGAIYLMIIHPPRMELGERHCSLIGFDHGFGFSGLYFSTLTSSYDPAQGLTFSVPGVLYRPEDGFQNSILLHVTVNQATGRVVASYELGAE